MILKQGTFQKTPPPNNKNMNRLKKAALIALAALASLSATAQTKASAQDMLMAAIKEEKTVLMVVGDKANPSTALKTLAESVVAGKDNVAIIEADKEDKANASFVSTCRIESAPMPLLLVFTNKGLLLGGLTEKQASKEAIANILPTPKYSEMMQAISQGKSVIAVVSNAKFSSDKSANTLCRAVASKVKNGAEVINVDSEDGDEATLIKMLNIKETPKDSYIAVINGQGMVTAGFGKLPTEAELLEAATKTVHVHSDACGCGHHH